MSPPGGAIRTPIRFGASVQAQVDKYLPGRTQVIDESSERFLMIGYQQDLGDGWYSFLMVQGARQAGKFAVEVGLSRRTEYPYHQGSVVPFLGVDSVRVRLQDDRWWTYRSQQDLDNNLAHLFREAPEARVVEAWRPRLEDEMGRSMDGWLGWKEAEAQGADLPLGQRFSALVREREALDYVQSTLATGRYARLLGPLARRYHEDPRWLSCHTYQMAALLDSVSPEIIAQYDGTWSGFSEDQSMWLTGRIAVPDWVEVPADYEARAAQYCFLKAMAVCEAWLGGS